MKALYKYIIISLFSLLIFSCKDYLEEDNRSNITAENYFITESGYESLVNAAYATLKPTIGNFEGGRGCPYMLCSGVDIYWRGESELVGGTYESRDIYSSQLNEYTVDAQNSFVDDFYTELFAAVQTCNTAIARADDVNEISDSRKKQLVAEVKFLRAYYYYHLVEQWGPVPIVKDEIKGPVSHFNRDSEESVYQFMISDLEDAIGELPATTDEFGRVTQGAAKHLLALVYLTRGYKSFTGANDFSTAATLADEVINSGNYALQNTFEQVFNRDNETNDEIIFSIQYDLGPGLEGSTQSRQFGWLLADKEIGFAFGDLQYPLQYPQFMPNQFLFGLFNTSMDSRYDATFNSVIYATADVPDIGLSVGDVRLYFPKPDQPFTMQDSMDYMAAHPAANIITFDNWKQDIEQVGGSGKFPLVWKFHDPQSPDVWTSTRDVVLFRLAQTYLIAAEAYFKSGDMPNAVDRLNTVRVRAAIPGNETAMEIQASDVDIDFILDERARELVGEYKRWYDLKRTGKLVERTLMYNNLAKRDNVMSDFHRLRPIPQSAIDRDDGNFPQNPGYN